MPAESESITFKKLFKIPLRNGIFRPTRLRGSGIKMVNMGEIFAHSIIGEIPMDRVELTLNEMEKCLLEPDDLIFARSSLTLAGAGKCSIFQGGSEPTTFESHIIRVRLDRNIAEPWFYYYFFNSRLGRRTIETIVEQVAAAGIRASDLAELSVPYLPLEQQRSIANVLKTIDFKIRVNHRMNRTLESIGKAIFRHWFIDFEFPNAEDKPYKSSGGTMIDSDLGKIPKGWRTGRLAECVNTVKGCSYRSDDLKESETALVTLKSFNRGGGFNQEGYKEYVGEYNEEQILKEGEIVVAQTDLTQKAEVIGRPAIVNSIGKYSKLVASLDLQIIRPKDNFSRNYAYYLLSTDEFHNHALSYTNGTTVLHLNKNAVPEFVSIIPPKEILNKFDKILDAMLRKIAINTTEIHTLSLIRDSLLPKLMSGKIRVPMEVT